MDPANRICSAGACLPGLLLFLVGLCAQASQPAQVDTRGQHQGKEIRLGTSTALSGPAAALGVQMNLGLRIAFEEANAAGGIEGGLVKHIVKDDAYEPKRSAPNVRELIESDGVLALVGNVGTPTAVVNLPICLRSGALYIGAFSGAEIVRPAKNDPMFARVFNFRASYSQEIAAMVDALVDHAGIAPERIGFFTQRDAYGDSGFRGGLAALRRRGLPECGPNSRPMHVRYERNTTAIEPAVADLLEAALPPEAVIMVGSYEPSAVFVKACREAGYSPIFLSVSFVGGEALAESLGAHGDGVIITQVVPSLDSDLPVVRRFMAAHERFGCAQGLTPGLGALEGYCVGRIVLEALRECGEKPTRAALAAALEGLGEFDIGLGYPLVLSPERHQASDMVWPTVVRQGRVHRMDWAELAGHSGSQP